MRNNKLNIKINNKIINNKNNENITKKLLK